MSNISIKIIPKFWTKFGNFRQISDGLRKETSLRTEWRDLIGSELLYISSTDTEILVCF